VIADENNLIKFSFPEDWSFAKNAGAMPLHYGGSGVKNLN